MHTAIQMEIWELAAASLALFLLQSTHPCAQRISLDLHSIPFPPSVDAFFCACLRVLAGVTSLGCRICKGRGSNLGVWMQLRSRSHARAIQI